mmetsp:Transcript_72932/g.200179  ORF Transcript_72932/g.200179 Transcript_72932/m.200179 type:complete len:200 (-) Transcript_72932:1736-2335(-)
MVELLPALLQLDLRLGQLQLHPRLVVVLVLRRLVLLHILAHLSKLLDERLETVGGEDHKLTQRNRRRRHLRQGAGDETIVAKKIRVREQLTILAAHRQFAEAAVDHEKAARDRILVEHSLARPDVLALDQLDEHHDLPEVAILEEGYLEEEVAVVDHVELQPQGARHIHVLDDILRLARREIIELQHVLAQLRRDLAHL